MSRVNRAIELLEQGQPLYYTGAGELTYENGVEMAQTWADYLMVEMEHFAFNIPGLSAFMRGLIAGGPTRSGHRTPTVIATLPTDGTSEEVMRANAWMVKHLLTAGVHGILLCHAETPGAVRAFVESARFPFQSIGVGEGLGDGRRGSGGQGEAAAMWGLSVNEYLDKADPWPLNPHGELLLGLKIEDKRCLANAEANIEVPGVGFAEWGPGDMGMSLGYEDNHDPPYPEYMLAARARVFAACKSAGIAFLNGVNPDNVTEMLDDGVRIGSGGAEAAEIGRRHTGRTMPW